GRAVPDGDSAGVGPADDAGEVAGDVEVALVVEEVADQAVEALAEGVPGLAVPARDAAGAGNAAGGGHQAACVEAALVDGQGINAADGPGADGGPRGVLTGLGEGGAHNGRREERRTEDRSLHRMG